MFEYGARLKRALHAKLVLDYRDLWTTMDKTVGVDSLNDYGSGIAGRLLERRFQRMESTLLDASDGVVTVSEAYREVLAAARPTPPVVVVYNGHDPLENLAPVQGRQPDGVFKIAYAGQLRREQRVDKFLQGLELLLREHREVEGRLHVHFVGSGISDAEVLEAFDGFAFADVVRISDFLPKEQALREIQSAHLLLQLSFEGKRGVISSKIFQYLGARIPILLVSNTDDCMEELIRTTRTGYVSKTPGGTATYLKDAFDRWSRGEAAAYAPREDEVRRCSFEHQVEVLNGFLMGV